MQVQVLHGLHAVQSHSCLRKGKTMTLFYDPPSGWMYGFPKPYKPLPGEKLKDTLLRDGYPQKELDQGSGNHVRFIGTKEEIASLEN